MYVSAIRYATQSEANAAIVALKGKPGLTHYAAGHIAKETGLEYFLIKQVSVPLLEKGAAVRNERFVYTASGKKRTNKEVCLALFRKHNEKAAFVAAAMEKGVKQITAVTYFDDIKAGRVK